jgi:predicted TIM-barrel fold metal-dependent hydrolase
VTKVQEAPKTSPDPEIFAAVSSIKAIDNHCHPEQVLAEGETDTEWDSFPPDAYQPPRVQYVPANVRPHNPTIVASWRALWGIHHLNWSEAAVIEALENKRRIKKDNGDTYPAWVLDQAGVDIALSNRVTMQRGLHPPKFRWVAYADLYLFPLSTAGIRTANPLYAGFYSGIEQRANKLVAQYRGNTHPATLKGWLADIVIPNLEEHQREGAVAIKFTAAYYRALDFSPVSEQEASLTYSNFIRGGTPNLDKYEKLQNYIFFQVAHAAARLKLPMHFHCGPGGGAQYSLSRGNPLLLEKAILNLPDTDFVLLHGGWPYSQQTTGLLAKSNVFVDFSGQAYFMSPRILADTLRYWLEYMPEKVLFGTDAYPNPQVPQASWEEFEWINTQNARKALALALTDMRNDGDISTERAKELARMVLHDNTAKLHRL